MVRTYITALVLLLTLLSANLVLAFGLGEITVKSYLNQPFVAEIELLELGDLTKDEIIPKLASEKDFANAGLQRDFFLSSLKFEVVLEEKSERNFVLITTNEPVTEPFLDFLVEFLWPEGRLLRGYTVLLDPPTYAASQLSQAETIPVVELDASDNTTLNETESAELTFAENAVRDEEESAQVMSPPEQGEASSINAQEESLSYDASNKNFSRRTITTVADDTLWSIVNQESPVTTVSVQQVMIAIQKLNPDAFIHNNINYLKKNHVLRIPTEAEIRLLSAREALTIVAEQNRVWAGRTMANGATLPPDIAKFVGSSQVTPMAEGDLGEQMKLVTEMGDDGKAVGTSSGEGNGSNTDESSKSSREAAQLLEQMKAIRSQVETSERLISLKDQQIAELQARLAEKNAASSTKPDEEINNVIERVAVAEPKNEISNSKEVSEEKQIAEAESDQDKEGALEKGLEEKVEEENKDANFKEEGADVNKAADSEEISFKTKTEEPTESKSVIQNIMEAASLEGEPSKTLLFVALGLLVLALLGSLYFKKKRALKATPIDISTSDSSEDEDFNDSNHLSTNAFADSDLNIADDKVLNEADTYISFNRYTQAIELLKKAINSGNNNVAVKIKLLEAYVGVSDRHAFDSLSKAVLIQDPSKQSAIEKLSVQMNADKKQAFDMETSTRMSSSDFELDKNSNEEDFDISLDDLANDLDANFSSELEEDSGLQDLSLGFAESAGATFAAEKKTEAHNIVDDVLSVHSQTLKIPPKDDDLDLNLDDLSFYDDSSAKNESVALDLSQDDEFDLDFKIDNELDSNSSTEVKAALESSDDLELDLDFDLDLDEDFSIDAAKESTKNDQFDLSSEPDLEEDFDLRDDGDQTATKLDLARAYIDMGDEEGARDILKEVIAEGDAVQQTEAKELMTKL